MKIIIQIVSLFFVVINLQAQDKYSITPNSVGDIYLGDPISVLKDKFPENSILKVPVWEFNIGGSGDGYLIVLNEIDSLMFVWSKDYDKTIGGIVCLSNKYKTVDDFGIGSTVEDIEKKHSYIYLRPSFNNSSLEYVTLKYNNGFINFQILNKPGFQIGKYDSTIVGEPSTKEFDRSAKVTSLIIWE